MGAVFCHLFTGTQIVNVYFGLCGVADLHVKTASNSSNPCLAQFGIPSFAGNYLKLCARQESGPKMR